MPPKGLTPKQEQKAVLEFAEDFERKVKGGANVKYTKMTFRSFCNELYENHLATLKPRTASGYRIIMESRLIPHFGDMKMRDITSLDIQYWLANLERKFPSIRIREPGCLFYLYLPQESAKQKPPVLNGETLILINISYPSSGHLNTSRGKEWSRARLRVRTQFAPSQYHQE